MALVEAKSDEERIVITGAGAVGPNGLNLPEVWQNVRAGVSAIKRISEVRGVRMNEDVDIAGMIPNFDGKPYFTGPEYRKVHESTQYFYVAGGEAGVQARVLDGLPAPTRDKEERGKSHLVGIDPEEVGVIEGTGVGGTIYAADMEDLEIVEASKRVAARIKEARESTGLPEPTHNGSADDLSPEYISAVINAVMSEAGRTPPKRTNFHILRILPERGAIVFSKNVGTKGDEFSINAACAGGLRAIIEAYKTIYMRDAQMIFAGGTEAPIHPIGILSFSALPALSRRNSEPERASRPFDQAADGFVIAEEAAVFTVESLASAKRRGVEPMAEILGYGNSSDAYHETAPAPGGEGAQRAMRKALKMAGLKMTDIKLVGAHGTSTGETGDGTELDGIAALAGDNADKIPVTSTKSLHGHGLGAAGAYELAILLMAMKDSFIPGTLNLENSIRPNMDIVGPGGRSASLDIVMKNAFGFGGINASLIVAAWGALASHKYYFLDPRAG